MIFEAVEGFLVDLDTSAVALVLNDHIAQITLPRLAAIGVADLLHIADIVGLRDPVGTGISILAIVAATVRAILELDLVIALDDRLGFIEGVVSQAAAITMDVVAIGVVTVGGIACAGDRMRACTIATILPSAGDPGLAEDIALGVIVHRDGTLTGDGTSSGGTVNYHRCLNNKAPAERSAGALEIGVSAI